VTVEQFTDARAITTSLFALQHRMEGANFTHLAGLIEDRSGKKAKS
jgi:hypothetical protein